MLQRKVSNKFDIYEISYGSLVDMVGPNKLNTYHAFVALERSMIITSMYFKMETSDKIKDITKDFFSKASNSL